MTETNLWNEIKDYYYERFGIAPELVDIAPVLDILRLCASGSSNKSIATFLGETEIGIAEVIDAYLGFMGWKDDLTFSPLKHYKQIDEKNILCFEDSIAQYLPYSGILNSDIEKMFNASSMVDKLERLFDEKWI